MKQGSPTLEPSPEGSPEYARLRNWQKTKDAQLDLVQQMLPQQQVQEPLPSLNSGGPKQPPPVKHGVEPYVATFSPPPKSAPATHPPPRVLVVDHAEAIPASVSVFSDGDHMREVVMETRSPPPARTVHDRTVKPWRTADGSRRAGGPAPPKFSFLKKSRDGMGIVRPKGKTRYELAVERRRQREQEKLESKDSKGEGNKFTAHPRSTRQKELITNMKAWREKQHEAHSKAQRRAAKRNRSRPVVPPPSAPRPSTPPKPSAQQQAQEADQGPPDVGIWSQPLPTLQSVPVEDGQDPGWVPEPDVEPAGAAAPARAEVDHLPNVPRRARTKHHPKYSHHVSQVFGGNARPRLSGRTKLKRATLPSEPKVTQRELKTKMAEYERLCQEAKASKRESTRARTAAAEDVKRARLSRDEAQQVLEDERTSFTKWRNKEKRKLEKARLDVNQQLRKLRCVPDRTERDQIAQLKAEAVKTKKDHASRVEKLKADNNRMRKTIGSQRDTIKNLREEVQRLEKLRLEAWGSSAASVPVEPPRKPHPSAKLPAGGAQLLYSNSYANTQVKRPKPGSRGNPSIAIVHHGPGSASSAIGAQTVTTSWNHHGTTATPASLPLDSATQRILAGVGFNAADVPVEESTARAIRQTASPPSGATQAQLIPPQSTVPPRIIRHSAPVSSTPPPAGAESKVQDLRPRLAVNLMPQATGLPAIPTTYRPDRLPTSVQECGAITGVDAILKNPDPATAARPGGTTQTAIFPDGSQRVRFTNGCTEVTGPPCTAGELQRARFFANGDLEKTLGDGRIVYYYASSNVVSVTCPRTGREDTFFETQHEVRFRSGRKEVTRPNGQVEVHPSG